MGIFSQQRFRWFGLFTMVTLLLLSVVFYKERAIFCDFAFQSFGMIQKEWFNIQVNRFGVVLIQVLPLMALKMGASLKTILQLYSVSIPLLFLVCYALAVWKFRSVWMGWTIVFLFTLPVFDGFYWATSEFQQGLAVLLLTFAILHRQPNWKSWQTAILLTLLSVALCYYHPLIFLVFLFLWGYFWKKLPKFRTKQNIALIIFVVWVTFVKSLFSKNWYDDHKFSTFFDHLKNDFPNYFSYASHQKFLENSVHYWYVFPALLLFLTIFYLSKKRFFNLAYVWLWCLGWLFLHHISSPNATYRFYAEVNYYPLTVFVIVPILKEALPIFSKKGGWVFGVFVVICLLRLVAIAQNHRPFAERLTWMDQQFEKMENQNASKLILLETAAMTDTLLITWGIAYETLLYSSLEHSANTKTILVVPNPAEFAEPAKRKDVFLTTFQRLPITELPPQFFQLDTAQAYLFPK